MHCERVLITGIAGFTGHHLIECLHEANPEMNIFGVDIQNPACLDIYEFIQTDILDYSRILDVITQTEPNYIFHLGGVNFCNDPKLFFDINVVGTLNLLEAVRTITDQIDPKILIVGSSAEYGIVSEDELPISEDNPLRPISHYGVSKVAQDLLGLQYFRNFNLKVIRVRPFNLIGPGQSTDFVCGALVNQIVEIENGIRSSEIQVGNLETERDFIDVRDIVQAYWQLMLRGCYGEVYNIGFGRSYSVRRVMDILLEKADVEVNVIQDEQRVRQSDIPRQVSNIDKITNQVGWRPKIPLEISLGDMLQYSRKIFRDTC